VAVESIAGEPEVRLEVALAPGVTLTGRTVVKGTRTPVTLADIVLRRRGALHDMERPLELPEEDRVHVQSDAEGRFHFDGVAPGEVMVVAFAPGRTPAMARGWAPQKQELVLELGAAATLEGFVLNEQGIPIADAEVSTVGSGAGKPVKSGPEGGFSMEVTPGTHALSARKGPAAGSLAKALTVRAGETAKGLRLVLRTGAAIEGRVVRKGGTVPVPGALVEATVHDHYLSRGQAFTNGEGHFRIEGLPAGVYDLEASAAGHAEAKKEGLGLLEGEVLSTELALEGHGVLVGSVKDEQGRPLPAASVHLLRWTMSKRAVRTDAQGRYRLDAVPAGRQRFEARWEPSINGASLDADIRPGEETSVDFVVSPAATLEGQVVRGDGAPLDEPVSVMVFRVAPDKRPPGNLELRTDDAGRFRAQLAAADYQLTARLPGRLVERRRTLASLEPGATKTVRLVLDEKGAPTDTVKGIVLDGFGEPVPRARGKLLHGAEIVGFLTTDETGRFEAMSFDESAKTFNVQVSRNGAFGEAKQVARGAGEVVIRLKAAREVRGQVVGSSGKPVAGFDVRWTAAEGPRRFFAFDDADTLHFAGERFVLSGIPDAPLTLMVTTRDGESGKARVSPGESAVTVRVAQEGLLKGRLVLADAGQPTEGFLQLTGPRNERLRVDAGGRFELKGLPEGTYRLRAMTLNELGFERELTLGAAQRLDLGDIALKPRLAPPGSLGFVPTPGDAGWHILHVLTHGPAAQAGVQIGDVLVAIDGTSLVGKTKEAFAPFHRGEPGARVTLTLRRKGSGREETVVVTRAPKP
jgi:protocatechuate 3,4-dioxygenase beta subunit